MDVIPPADLSVSSIAAAIGEPARVRMLYCLADGRARTGTELAVVAEVSPSTASVHLRRLIAQQLVKVSAQGKHRYYSLGGTEVASALEALSVVAGRPRVEFVPSTPVGLRSARTCYDHIAGALGVALFDRFSELGWLSADSANDCEITRAGTKAFLGIGIDIDALRVLRRRFAYTCLDWSERRSHLGGALGAAVLSLALERKWVQPDLSSRALTVTSLGRRELMKRFGVRV